MHPVDLFDRKIIGGSLSSTMYVKDTSTEAFKMALLNRLLKRTYFLIFIRTEVFSMPVKSSVLG